MSDVPTAIPASSSLPQGVVTFVFTDIEGSTRLLERHPQVMAGALARHHELLAEAIDGHHGVVFETVGDAVYGAFAEPSSALVAAVEIQRRLAHEDWGEIGELRARIAIHSGSVEVRGRHYFGAALFECSRLQALAHGGQTLCSETTAALARASLPADISLRPLGRQRLKDLDDVIDVVQVDGEGLPQTFPPLRATASAGTNLPHATTSFIGRTAELERIDGLIAEHRLVSLLGPGGCGKTRLALEVAAAATRRFRDGAWLVELAPVTTGDLVLTQVADVWGLRPGQSATLEEVVRRYLAEREVLLVLDNCEHVREGAATVTQDLLRDAPGLTILATSRESLGVVGEIEYRVGTLALPTEEAADVVESEAVSLFLDRARAVRPDLELTSADLAGAVRVCRRLEGMPLGLELAAARVRALSPAELADRLDASFLSLGSSSKSTLPRQRTLAATLDWSHDLLTDVERTVFRRLAVLAGSFDLLAAERLSLVEPLEADVLEVLESLVDKSLVLALSGSPTRYRLLEPVRQYAREHLDQAGETARVSAAHADHYAAVVAGAAPHLRGPAQMAWDRRLDADYPNIRLALEHLLAAEELDRYLVTSFHLFLHWAHVGMHVEGVATLRAGLERIAPSVPVTEAELQARFAASLLLAEITDTAGIDEARRGLQRARRHGDPNAIGRLELALGAAIRHSTNEPEYLEHLLTARTLLDEHPQPRWWEATWEAAFIDFILAAYLPADESRSEAHIEGALAGFRQTGDDALYAATLTESVGHWGTGRDDVLMVNLEHGIELMSAMRLPYWYSHALLFRGSLRQAQGHDRVAIGDLAESARQLESIGDLSCWAAATRRLATAEAAVDDTDAARQALAAAIESLPGLPLADVHVPRSLDAAVEVLLAMGRVREAAIVLGCARETIFDAETVLPRDETLERLHEQLSERLEEDELAERMTEGAQSEARDILGRVVGWLRWV